MHEMALAESVVQIVERQAREAGADRITVVWLEIGALSHVMPEAIRFSFEAVSQGSMAQGAALEILRVPGRAWCHDCGTEIEIAALGDACPLCGGYKVQITGGQEMRVKEMEVA
ncbi:hydrogenase maturation nickel metallochaperone HypA [Sinisalibacter aestuarii]|uniref:Hydrogenase maturation factor HypA n=1 Tax=Sinisalibacter aestuarii TaxID=2949426 RepID=A0ABQ5LRU7_9RHOB|nr:hydrogenase maturation nickel metallochaperone HypA [Sinisalibacter aestuarii]GKY87348.1 putative hydrogenase nickel incorporation protein HypA 2 [Sinisalibacter aestuarii]